MREPYTMQPAPEVQTTQPPPPVPVANVFKIFVSVVAFVLLFVGFLLQLGGVGDVHSECNDESNVEGDLVRELISLPTDCEDRFRSLWWATFFQFLLGIAVGVVLLLDVVKDVNIALSIFMAISTVQIINAAEDALDMEEESGPRAAATGYIFSAMGNFMLICVIGVTGKPTPHMPKMPSLGGASTQQVPTVSNPTGGSSSGQPAQIAVKQSMPTPTLPMSQMPNFQTRSQPPSYQTQSPSAPSPSQQPQYRPGRGGGVVDI